MAGWRLVRYWNTLLLDCLTGNNLKSQKGICNLFARTVGECAWDWWMCATYTVLFVLRRGLGEGPLSNSKGLFNGQGKGMLGKIFTSIASILSRIGRTYEKKGNLLPLAISPKTLKSKSRWLLCSPMGFPPRPRCASSFELLGLVIACLWSSWWWRPTSQVQSWCFHVDLWSMLLCHTGPYSSNYWIDLCTCTNLISSVQWSSIVFHAISLAERRK